MNKILLFLFCLLYSLSISGQIIPQDRQINWYQTQNIEIKIPARIINITKYGAVGDGKTDNFQAFQKALAEAVKRPAVIYFPEGKFLFKNTISLKSNTVIKGSGSGKTVLLFDLGKKNKHCIIISGSTTKTKVNINSGYLFGSSKIKSDSAFSFSAGQLVEIREKNGDWDTHPISWAKDAVGQLVIVDKIKGKTLYLHSPLRINYEKGLNPTLTIVNPVRNAGIQDIKIKRIDKPAKGGGYNILISLAKNCFINGIESEYSVASHVYVMRSLNIRITGSYFHHAFEYDGASTHGYGVTLAHRASECIVENNIFKHLRHAMMIKTGANGNVFGYNYSTDVISNDGFFNYAGDISVHGHFPYANLFEGNIVENIVVDRYWGPAGPLNTFFRNRTTGWGIIFTPGFDIKQFSKRQNLVGNEVVSDAFLHGQYLPIGEDLFQYGNNIKGEIVPEGTNNLSDSSYYLKSKPSFWGSCCKWPSIGIPNKLESGTIPAKLRYNSGGKMTITTYYKTDTKEIQHKKKRHKKKRKHKKHRKSK